MDRKDLKPIPRRGGKIALDEYRELMWFSQQGQEQEMIRINKTIGKHEERITNLEKDSVRIKAVGGFSVLVLGVLTQIKRLWPF